MNPIKPSNFDKQGRHWQTHGTNVEPLDAHGLPMGQRMVVHSQFEPRLNRKPITALTVNGPLGSVDLRMTAAGARDIARALTRAADLADQVEAELEARRK